MLMGKDRYLTIFNTVHDALFIHDVDGHIIDVNDTTLKQFDLSIDEAKKLIITKDLLGPDVSLAEVESIWKRVLEGDKFAVEYNIRRPNTAESFPAEIRLHRIYIDDRYYILTSMRDISDRVKAEKALQESEKRYRLLVENNEFPVVVTSVTTGRVLFINERAATFFEVPALDAIGQPACNYWQHPEVRDTFLIELLANGRVANYECELKSTSGKLYWVLLSANIIEYKNERAVFLVCNDITQRKRAQEALRVSEERYRMLADTSPEMIYLVDTGGYVQYVNPSAASRMARKLENIIGKHLSDLFSKESASGHCKAIQNVILTRQVHKGEILEDFPIGKLWIDVLLSPVIDKNNSVIGVLGLSNDITSRKNAEEALKESEALFRSQFEFGNIGIAITSVEKGWLKVNRRLCEMFGYPEEELRQKTWSEMTHPEDLARDLEQFNRVLDGESETYELDKRFVRKDKTILETHLTVSCYRNEDRSVRFFIASFLDITERVRAEEARVEMERRLLHSQKLESLGILAGGIAHDFNNLLAAIIGNLDIALLDLPEDSPAREDIEQALKASARATDLTCQMLAYSGKGHFAIKQLSINDIVHGNADIFKAIIPKAITINLELANTISLIVADQGQIQQVVMNLITNASEAIGHNPGTITIKTGVGDFSKEYLIKSRLEIKPSAGKFVFVEVGDSGCGMDEDTQHRLFDPFFTTKFTGRGLGMSAVSGIVSGHKGAIIINSEPGTGTTIRVLFPAYDLKKSQLLNQASQNKDTIKDSAQLSGTILVVDDEEIVRKYTAAVITRLGFKAITAANGDEAVQVFRKQPDEIACVILDLTMPIMDGLTTFRELKRIKPDLKVILLSGYTEQDATGRFNGQGLSGFIQKPFRFEDLREKLFYTLAGSISPVENQVH
jgi:PAS domain S-box-containing protein